MPGAQDTETMQYFGHSGLVLNPRNHKDRKQIELENNAMERIRAQRQQAQQFDASHAQTERLRGDALNESRQRFDLAQAQQRDIHDATRAETELRTKVAQQQADTQRLNALQLQLGDPNLKDQHPAIKQEIMRIMGIQNNTTTGGVPAKGAYGPGGAPVAPNAATAKKGEYGPGGAPATTASTTQYAPPTAAFTGQPAPQTGGERPAVGPTGAVDQGGGFAPNGYPILPNTPEPRYVPLGHGSLEGSTLAPGGIQTPSGGFIGTPKGITPGIANLVDPTGGAATVARQTEAGFAPGSQVGIPFRGTGGYTPPTTSFTTGGSAAQPGAAPAPAANAPIDIHVGVPGQPPVHVASIGLDPNVPSNQRQDSVTNAVAPAQITPYGPGSNQAQDLRAGMQVPGAVAAPIPVNQPQAQNDRGTLLNDIEGTFYGGGNAYPKPTPKPTPVPPRYQPQTQAFYA